MMNHLARLAALPLLLLAMPALAQDSDPPAAQATGQTPLEMRAEQIVAMINGEADPQDIFTDGFLAAIPLDQVAAIGEQLTGQFGAALAVESVTAPDSNRSALAIRMERAIARGGLAIDPTDDNRVSELLFQTFDPIDDTAAKIEADLEALPGEVTYWFGPLDGGNPVLASADDPQMPLGSTFKLYVLAALAREVAEGKRSWSDVVTLDEYRSFPSGMMQDWPDQAPVTLHTLASLMISISDNTATDELIRVLGRDAVYETLVASGHSAPELNDPFMSTREMFLLKGGPESRLSAYRSGDANTREQILDGIESLLLPTSQIEAAFSGGPVALDVEWFGSTEDLRNLFAYMRENVDPGAFGVMAIHDSMDNNVREKWSYAGYKGGSEPGVLNLTWLLTDGMGRDHALVLSWKNESANVEKATLELIAQRILALIP